MAAKKRSANIPQDKLDLYERLVATNPAVERKGDTVPYTSVNGHMFSFLGKDGSLALRLPPEGRELFLKKYKTTLVTAYGMVMKEYVLVPEQVLANIKALAPYFEQSFQYVKSLKAKPTKKTSALKKK